MPVYYWLSRWFVERGYVVVLPQRRGHGATGGALSESLGSCDNPKHYASGSVAANDISAAIDYMTGQPGIAPSGVVVVGISTGGWAALALAARNLPKVQAIVNFAGGRGGHAYGQPNAICGTDELIAAARLYGQEAREPTIWYYAKNDFLILVRSSLRDWQKPGAAAAGASRSIFSRPTASRVIRLRTTVWAGKSGVPASKVFWSECARMPLIMSKWPLTRPVNKHP